MSNPTDRAALYARVSYYDADAENLNGQLAMGAEHAQRHGYRTVAELSEDNRGISGAVLERPALDEALRLARAGEIDVLVVREPDRMARDVFSQLSIDRLFKDAGVRIEYVLRQYDDSPAGELHRHFDAAVAQFERSQITERMLRRKRQKAQEGNAYVHGRPPLGYRAERDDAGAHRLAIDDEEARIIADIFRWYVYGIDDTGPLSTRKVAQRLTSLGIPSAADRRQSNKYTKRRPRGEWSPTSISRILRNPVYRGEFIYGKSGDTPISVECPAIVSAELWQAARVQATRHVWRSPRNVKRAYLLRRRARCGRCGRVMVASSSPKRDGGYYLYYRCVARVKDRYPERCDMLGFRADGVDATAWRIVREYLTDPARALESVRRNRERRGDELGPLQSRLDTVAAAAADKKARLEKVLDLYLSGSFDRAILEQRRSALEQDLAALEQEHAGLLARVSRERVTARQETAIVTALEQIARGLAVADREFEKRQWIIEMLDVQAVLDIADDGTRRMSLSATLPDLCIANTPISKAVRKRAMLPLFAVTVQVA